MIYPFGINTILSIKLDRRIGGGGDLTWCHLNSIGLTWAHLDSLALIWTQWISLELTWTHLDSIDFTWVHLDSLHLTWTYLISLGLTWSHLDSLDVTWIPLISSIAREREHLISQGKNEEISGRKRKREKGCASFLRCTLTLHAAACARTNETKRFAGWSQTPNLRYIHNIL